MGANMCASRQSSTCSNRMRGGCFKIEKKMMKKQSFPQAQVVTKLAKENKLTLEEWLVASPGSSIVSPSGELHVFKQSSRRVHPSVIDRVNGQSDYKPREKVDGDDQELMTTSSAVLSRTQSGKEGKKKKVSFRLPHEADIILFYSPDQVSQH